VPSVLVPPRRAKSAACLRTRACETSSCSTALISPGSSTAGRCPPARAGVPADRTQADGQAVGGAQGVGVVLAQDAAAAGQGVFAQLPGRLVLADRTQANGEVAAGGQGVGVVLAEVAAAAGQGVFV
jgi:hypothetical protein